MDQQRARKEECTARYIEGNVTWTGPSTRGFFRAPPPPRVRLKPEAGICTLKRKSCSKSLIYTQEPASK